MKKRIVSLLLAAAMLVLLAVPAFAEDEHAYTYVALGDSITTRRRPEGHPLFHHRQEL